MGRRRWREEITVKGAFEIRFYASRRGLFAPQIHHRIDFRRAAGGANQATSIAAIRTGETEMNVRGSVGLN